MAFNATAAETVSVSGKFVLGKTDKKIDITKAKGTISKRPVYPRMSYPANFRQILARARKQLAQFMEKNCGLVYPQAKCKCKSKVMPQIKRGMIQPGNLKFSQQVEKIKQLVGKKKISTKLMIEKDIKTLYQDHPFYRPEDKTMIVKKVLAKP
ncbi:MAG: hypothetical protein GY729_14545, partial [Desulfobacteraceae bacterium]|nr:hypothetical protein [Desulfobacteraceae bacterium]